MRCGGFRSHFSDFPAHDLNTVRSVTLPFTTCVFRVTRISSVTPRVTVHGIAIPEKEGLQRGPELLKTGVLREYVGRVVPPVDMREADDPGSNGFSDTVISESVVALAQGRVGQRRAGDVLPILLL